MKDYGLLELAVPIGMIVATLSCVGYVLYNVIHYTMSVNFNETLMDMETAVELCHYAKSEPVEFSKNFVVCKNGTRITFEAFH